MKKEKSNSKTINLNTESDLEKDIEGNIEEVENEGFKVSDLYYNYLYLPVLSSRDTSLGIFPEDQQISNQNVILWNSVKTIPTVFTSSDYKILKVEMSHEIIQGKLKSHGSGVYSLPFIPNTISIEEVGNQSLCDG